MRHPGTVRGLAGLVLVLGLGLGGCATPRQQVASGLQSLGLGARQAACMAESLDDRLSDAQMRRVAKLVGGASRADQVEANERNLRRAVDLVFGVAEPEIASAASRALLACTILGG